RVKTVSVLLALAGLGLATLLIGWFGFNPILHATLSVGWSGLALLAAWQCLMFALLGFAWKVILPPEQPRPPWRVLLWGRMVRDASANLLPFSQVGGFVFGARAITLHGVAWPLASASTVVDVTAEFLAQLAFAAIGLLIVVLRAPHETIAIPAAIGLGLAVLAGGAFVWLQRGAGSIFARLGPRIAPAWFAGTADRLAAFQGAISAIYAHPGRLAAGFLIHLLGWIAAGISDWMAYRLLGHPIGVLAALAIEALLSALAAAAFLVPVSAGVQEAGYVGLGALFGLRPDISLAVSLLRRARDVVVGVPILLAWQGVEMRRLRARRRGVQPQG
ncbi:MAG: flippase-like domain-containing protein, partial [Rhodospirillales bacterium]|nr:flippase-like domain-containing protein [Rhodospirillales bacterium]